MFCLENEYLVVRVDEKGRLVHLENKKSGQGNIISQPSDGLFKLVAKTGQNWENVFFAAAQNCRIIGEGHQLTLIYDQLVSRSGTSTVALVLTIELCGPRLLFGSSLNNQAADLLITDWTYPIIGRVRTLAGGKPDLLWPNHMGERITNIGAREGETALTYPGGHGRGASMQWFALTDGDQVLSLAGRDQTFYSSELRVTTETSGIQMEMVKLPFARTGETWTCPPYVLCLHNGSWHQDADDYRAWAAAWRRTPRPPKWIRELTGYFLVINKQQYGDEIWSYDTLPELYAYAQANGCDTLGLFGWYNGGHDNTYPDLTSSPTMGGDAGLRDNIRKVREQGGHVTLYYQGHLLDQTTDYYRTTGHRIESRSRWGTPYMEHYNKSHNSRFLQSYTAKQFATACPSCPEWQELMAEKVDYISEFGPNGTLYDQIGGMSPYPCFDERHPHLEGRPSLSYAPGNVKVLAGIQKRTKEVDPEFAFLTEHITDVYSGYADLLHGMYTNPDPEGSRCPSPDADTASQVLSYPELFRYTFPETIGTIRNGRPFISRRFLHYAFVFGLRHEMELRYLDDQAAIREDRHPIEREYARQVTDFRRRYQDLLAEGRFVDDLPLKQVNPAVIAKAFQAGSRLAVALWNDSGAAQTICLDVPGYTLVETAFVGGETLDRLPAQLLPQQIALVVFQK